MSKITASTFETGLSLVGITENVDGYTEVSSLTDIDSGLVNKLAAVIQRLHISDIDHPRNKRLAAFAARPVSEKIAMGEFESPLGFLKGLSKQGKDKISLPCLYVTRDPSIAWAELDKYPERRGIAELLDPDENYLGDVDQAVASLTYQVNIVGWQNDNIETLALLIMTWLRQHHSDHAFTAATSLGGGPYTLSAEITTRHDVMADSASLPFEENRLRALSLTLMVDAEVATVSFGDLTVSNVVAGSSVITDGNSEA